ETIPARLTGWEHWSANQDYALVPPVDHTGKLPSVGRRLMERLDQRGAVSDLGHAQNPGRKLPLPAWKSNRGNQPGGGAARTIGMGWCRLVGFLVRVFLEPRVHWVHRRRF